jgi:hypothetical protein
VTTSLAPQDLAALAALPDDALVGVESVAQLYACSARHVWRAADGGLIPPPLRIGRCRRWRIGALRDHIRAGCRPVRTVER